MLCLEEEFNKFEAEEKFHKWLRKTQEEYKEPVYGTIKIGLPPKWLDVLANEGLTRRIINEQLDHMALIKR